MQQPHPTYAAPNRPEQRTNHIFHLLMTVFTCGLWAPVWAIVAFSHKSGAGRYPVQYPAPHQEWPRR